MTFEHMRIDEYRQRTSFMSGFFGSVNKAPRFLWSRRSWLDSAGRMRIDWAVAFPYWVACLLFAVWPAIALTRAVQTRRRLMRGCCDRCGYNLRGSAGSSTCPECGTPIRKGHRAAGLIIVIGISLSLLAGCSDDPVRQITSPTPSSSGRYVAVCVTRGKADIYDPRLWLIDVSDGTARNMGVSMGVAWNPIAWHPDEQGVVVTSGERDHYGSLVRYPMDDGSLQILASGPCRYPAYDSSGTRLAFVRNQSLYLRENGTERMIASLVWYAWCWSNDGRAIYFTRDLTTMPGGGAPIYQHEIWRYSLDDGTERRLFDTGMSEDTSLGADLVISPGDDRLGFLWDGQFCTLELASGAVEKHFKCSHYFLELDWNRTGVLYLDAVDGNQRSMAQLMVYDPLSDRSCQIAVGGFASARWLDETRITVRVGNTDVWIYDATTGNGQPIFVGSRW
jgi:hypothetical protein